MSDTEEQKSCQTCSDFEPQTWRKSLCKNCFHTLEEHSADILANEANEVAKEKAEAKSSEKVTEVSTVQPAVKPNAKKVDDSSISEGKMAAGRDDTKKTEGKEAESATLKRKYGAARCAGEKDSAWSWAKDLGSGYAKSAKPDSQDASKGIKGSATVSPIVPSAGTATSAKSAPTTTAKPSLKSTTASKAVATSETPSPALSSSSTSTTTTSPVTADTSTASVSKAKSFASKFESKASALSSSKSMSKPKDIRPGSTTVAALTGKLTDTAPGPKTKAKLPPEKADEPQQLNKKPDTKSPENVTNTETVQKLQKTDSVKAKDGVSVESKKDSKQYSDHSKDKLSEKIQFSVGSHPKAALFGKDALRSTKDSLKRDNILVEPVEKKAVSPPQTEHEETKKDTSKSHSAKSVSEKVSDNKSTKHASELATASTTNTDISQNNRNNENNTTVGSSSTPPDSKLAAGGSINNRQLAKITGRSVEGKKLENSETKDYIDATKDNEGDACEGRNKKVEINVSPSELNGKGTENVETKGISEDEKKNESSRSVLSTDASKGETPPLSTSIALKPTNAEVSSVDSTSSSYSQQSKTTEANKSQDIQLENLIDSTSVQSQAGRTKDLEEDNNEHNEQRTALTFSECAPSSTSQPELENNVEDSDKQKTNERDRDADTKDNIKKLTEQLKEKDEALSALNKQLSKMEEQVKMLEGERDRLQKESLQAQKDDMEKLLNDLRLQLSKMEEQCTRLDKDNQALIDKLHLQEASVKKDQESRGKTSDNVDLEEDLEAAEQELEEVKEENKELQRLIMEMKNEMDEMYDHFREHDHDEFREIQKELDMTAKNCRILQFKLRKAERRNDQIEQDRIQYEEKLRRLQDQFDSQDAKDHIRLLEEELRMAKEVSVRLHDELDVVEDKRNKALEENKHLTELLEHTDKRQFRLEMEIDKLRDIVADLKQQLKEAKSGNNNNNNDSTPDRKPQLGAIGKQGSREYDVSQLMKDLYDSMERENDLKDQLKFSEEEAKMMRRRVSEMDEENENLRLQLQKMSEKATKHKKKEKERTKELVEERSKSDAIRAALSAQNSQDDDFADVILIVGPEGSDLMSGDEPIPVSQRKDSTDEDLMNVMQMRVHLEMLEQELMTSHKKLDEMDLENENLQAEVKFLQERLAEKEVSSGLPEPSTPNAYYEDKLREMTQEADELRWKLIEKDREMERLTAVHTRHSREHSHKKCEKLKKSKSLEEADVVQVDPRKQLEHAQMEIARLKKIIEELTQVNEDLRAENEEYKNKTPVPSVHADDAAVENIELKENLRRLEETNRGQAEKIKTLSDSLQKLTRDTRSYTSIATSPTVPGTLSIPGIPLVGPGTQTARAGKELSNPTDDSNTRDLRAQLHVLQRENEELRRSMEELGVSGEESRDNTVAGKICDSKRKLAPISPVSRDSKTQREKESSTVSNEAEVVSRNIEKTVCDKQAELNAGGIQLANQVTVPSAFDSCQSNMEYKKESTKSTSSKASTTSAKDGGGKTKDTEEEDKDRVTTSAAGDVAKVSKEVTKDEPLRPISLDYPEGKSKVLISGSESRVELMEKVLEMDEEISDLIAIVRRREDESDRLKREVKYLNSQLRELKEESRRMEMDLLQELDMLHDKNSVMSNLLDIINERAEEAEEELERRMQEETTHSPVRSASNVSQVSALSDTSMGSDEVFLNAQFSKEGVITRDWEAKLKVRIESLERLLAEERQKVTMAEKKLMLAGIDSVSPSVSDDVKLRLREKELLQEELLKSQRHLHIATDQIQGLKERIHILEDEHDRLKKDYARLYEEIDKPLEKEHEVSTDTCLDSSGKKNSRQVRSSGLETNGSGEDVCKLEEELQKYKQRATELEYKVEEIDDIWRSKSAASDKDRNDLEQQLNQKIKEHHVLEQTLNNLKTELCTKDKIIAEINTELKDKSSELSKIAETMKDREGENKKHEQEQQVLMAQVSQRDVTIRSLNETIRIRDERLREKDDILCKLNTSIDEYKREITALTEKLNKMAGQLKENDAEISLLRGQLSSTSVAGSDVPRSCQTDAEKEGFRLKETVKKLQRELDKCMGDKRVLESNLEKSRKSLEEAMMMWDMDRHSLQKDANILEEKVRMYEAFNSMNRDETIETLKSEAQGYFNEKEALLCELSSEKLQHEADGRMLKEQQAKLQTELTEKLRLLKTEVDSNSHMTTEMNRLKRQAEMAYRLQQEQRVFKAEHLAMKVRYETRIDKMSKEHNKMLLTIDKLQKERDMDKQIIDGIQKNFNLVKDSYTEELLRSQEDKAALRRYVKEIEESRAHLDELQRHVRDLRDKTVDQDRLRADLINKFATDRSSWEIERANLISQVNQLEEKIFSSSRQQERSKDIQVNMGMAWEKERREQRRLLAEAHTLALDLQEQLRSRDEAFAHERKELLHQLENDRINLTKDKREIDRKIMEFESVSRKVIALEKRLKDVQDKNEKDLEEWQKERGDLLRAAAEARHAQARDAKMLENILSKLIRLRELGTMLTSQHKWDSLEEKPPDRQENIEQSIIDYVKEAVLQVSQVADDLTLVINPTPDEEAIKRISNSEIDLLKEEFSRLHHEADDVIVVADVTTSSTTSTTRIQEEASGTSRKLPKNAATTFTSNQPRDTAFSETVTKSSAFTVSSSPQGNTDSPTASHPPSTMKSSVPVVLRPPEATSRQYDRPPSYTSGTRSAQTSRAATPEVPDIPRTSVFAVPSRKSGFPEPPPSFVIPHHSSFQTQKQQSIPTLADVPRYSSTDKSPPKRPVIFMKSLSMDSGTILDNNLSEHLTSPQVTSISASNTPTQPVTSSDLASYFATPSVITSSGDHLRSAVRELAPRTSHSLPRTGKCSPRTARRQFFESYPTSASLLSNPTGYQSWPERRHVPSPIHTRQTSLPDPEEVRKEAEEEHDLVSSKLESKGKYSVMKSSTSYDEQMHRKGVAQKTNTRSQEDSPTVQTQANLLTVPDNQQSGSRPASAKEKRKLFKKAMSLDSTVGSSIAKVGVAAMPLGAPTGFTPSELFATVKGKLKPVFKKKSAESGSKGHEPRSPSPLFIQTEVPDIHFAARGSTSLPVPVPHVDVTLLDPDNQTEPDKASLDIPDERSRDSSRNDLPRGKWRSKSADRAQGAMGVHADVIRPQPGVWKFNETAV